MLTAVLECLGSENYRRVTPAVFEICMKIRYSENETDSMMFDKIRENIVYDLGQIIYDGTIIHQLPGHGMYNKQNWSRQTMIQVPMLNNSFKSINELLNPK